jgi:hypothetical protein
MKSVFVFKSHLLGGKRLLAEPRRDKLVKELQTVVLRALQIIAF